MSDTPQTGSDNERMYRLLRDFGLKDGDPYFVMEPLQNMAADNLIARFEAKLDAQNTKLDARNTKFNLLLWMLGVLIATRRQVCVALLVAVSGFSHAQVPDSSEYFPLAVGNSWTYATDYGLGFLGSETFGVSDMVVVNDTLYYVATYPFMFWSYGAPNTLLRADDNSRIWTRRFGKDMLLFDFSLESGATYSFPHYYHTEDSTEYTVTVGSHAGFSFRGLTFENLISIDFDDPEWIDEERGYSFAPGLGMVAAGGGHGETFVLDSAYVNGHIITSIDSDIPQRTAPAMAAAAYPNPFYGSVTVETKLAPGAQAVRAEVFDMLGRSVAVLPDPECTPGICRFTWDGKGASNGVYFVRLSGGKGSDTVPLVLRR